MPITPKSISQQSTAPQVAMGTVCAMGTAAATFKFGLKFLNSLGVVIGVFVIK